MKNVRVLRVFLVNVIRMVRGPVFIWLTISGNALVFLVSIAFYWIEVNINEKVSSFIDALWWGFATITTVGYGDIVPVTVGGKALGIFAMLIGTAIFATYTALFAQALLGSTELRVKRIAYDEMTNKELLIAIKKILDNRPEQEAVPADPSHQK